VGHAALGEVFAAAAASAEGSYGLFEEHRHVVGLARGLGEDQRRLRRFGGEQGDGCGRLASKFLGEEFDVGELAIGKGADDYFAAVGLWSLGEQGRGLRGGQVFLRLLALLAERLDLVERLADLLGDVVDVRGKERGSFGKSRKIATSSDDGALSGNELDPISLADFFELAQQHAGDLAGVGDVGATAGGEIEAADVDEAELVPLGGWKFAQPEACGFVATHEADVNGPIFEDDVVGQAFGGFDLILGERGRVEIDGAVVVGHVEGNGWHVEQADKRG